ncbi:hypothetical protein Tco_1261633 [Tanacetum coccineum]
MAEQDIPPPTITAMKIPIIKKGEYDIWSMRMRQYICHTDHNLQQVLIQKEVLLVDRGQVNTTSLMVNTVASMIKTAASWAQSTIGLNIESYKAVGPRGDLV